MEDLSLGPREGVDEAISARSFSISLNAWLPTVALKYNHAFILICKSSWMVCPKDAVLTFLLASLRCSCSSFFMQKTTMHVAPWFYFS